MQGSQVLLGQIGNQDPAYCKVTDPADTSTQSRWQPLRAIRVDATDGEGQEEFARDGGDAEQDIIDVPVRQARLLHVTRSLRRAIEDPASGPIAAAIHTVMIGFVLASTVCAALVTEPEIENAHHTSLRMLERAFTGVFTLEILVRLWAARSWGAYFCSLSNYIDILATLPWYVENVSMALSPLEDRAHLQDLAGSMGFLRIAPVLRMLRLARFATQSESMRIMWDSLRACRTGFSLLATWYGLGGTISATAMYAAEGDSKGAFRSMSTSMWWAMELIISLGYGDVVPSTTAGKFVGCSTMVVGTLIAAIGTGLICSSFAEQYRQRAEIARLEKNIGPSLRMRLPAVDDNDDSDCLDGTPKVNKSPRDLVRTVARLEEDSRCVLEELELALRRCADAAASPSALGARRGGGGPGGEQALDLGQTAGRLLLDSMKAHNKAFVTAARDMADLCILHEVASGSRSPCSANSGQDEDGPKSGECPVDAGHADTVTPRASLDNKRIRARWPRLSMCSRTG